MTMADPSLHDLHPPEFNPFLHASVGEDRNGYVVTVLSTFARLGLDPWKETADLVTLGHDAAQARLAGLLARFRDVPTLARDHDAVARDLSELLPDGRRSGRPSRAAETAAEDRPGAGWAIWAVLAIVFVLFRIFMAGGSGSGE